MKLELADHGIVETNDEQIHHPEEVTTSSSRELRWASDLK